MLSAYHLIRTNKEIIGMYLLYSTGAKSFSMVILKPKEDYVTGAMKNETKYTWLQLETSY